MAVGRGRSAGGLTGGGFPKRQKPWRQSKPKQTSAAKLRPRKLLRDLLPPAPLLLQPSLSSLPYLPGRLHCRRAAAAAASTTAKWWIQGLGVGSRGGSKARTADASPPSLAAASTAAVTLPGRERVALSRAHTAPVLTVTERFCQVLLRALCLEKKARTGSQRSRKKISYWIVLPFCQLNRARRQLCPSPLKA